MEIGCFLGQIEDGIAQCGLTDLPAALAEAAKSGITAVDVCHIYLDRYTPEELKELLASYGMHIASVHGLLRIRYRTEEDYLSSLGAMKSYMERAKAAGSPQFMIVPQMPEDYVEDDHEIFSAAVRRMFGELAVFGKETGILATVENFSDRRYPYTTFEDIEFLLKEHESLGFVYDSGNFTLAGLDELEGLRRFRERTVYAHLKDLKIVEKSSILREGIYYECVTLGDGMVKNAEAIADLKAAGYTGALIYENFATPDTFSMTLRSAERLKVLTK